MKKPMIRLKKVMLNLTKRIALIAVFFYFSAMMITLGNGSSFLGRYFESFFNPVANSIGLNTTWNFFSPDPAHTMYIKYFVFFEDPLGNSLKETVEGFYPESKDRGEDFSLDKKRDSYAMRFLAVDPARLQGLFTPWMCKKYPGSTKLQVELIVNRIPTLDKVIAIVNSNIDTYENLVTTEEISRYVFECPHAS